MKSRPNDLIAFLLAANMAALIWVAADASALDKSQWLTAGLPAWLQAIGTGAAVWIAWIAFNEWRSQEIAKAKAHQAYDILPKVQAFNTAIKTARTVGWTYGSPITRDDLQRFLTEPRKEKLRAALEKANELGGLSGIILDDHVKTRVDALMQTASDLEVHYHLMQEYMRQYDGCGAEGELQFRQNQIVQDGIKGALRAFGCRIRGDAVAPMGDELGRDMSAQIESIREALRNHIQYRGPLDT